MPSQPLLREADRHHLSGANRDRAGRAGVGLRQPRADVLGTGQFQFVEPTLSLIGLACGPSRGFVRKAVGCHDGEIRGWLADGVECGLHRIERLMRLQALRARPRRRRPPKDEGDRQITNVPANLLDRQFRAERPNQKWIADFTYIWTAEGWLYVSAVIDLFSRRVVGWSMSASITAQLVADAL